MKTRIFLVFCLTSVHIFADGQSFAGFNTINSISTLMATNEKNKFQIFDDHFCTLKINADSIKPFTADPVIIYPYITLKKNSDYIYMTENPAIGAGGTNYWVSYRSYIADRVYNAGRNNYVKKSNNRLTFTTLAMIAGIPHLVGVLKTKQIAGFRLACQRTSVGASSKARRKVKGVTFAIPLGK